MSHTKPNGFADHYPVFKWLAIIGKINPTFPDKPTRFFTSLVAPPNSRPRDKEMPRFHRDLDGRLQRQRFAMPSPGIAGDLGLAVMMPPVEADMDMFNPWAYPAWWTNKKLLKMAIEIVEFPIKNGDFPELC